MAYRLANRCSCGGKIGIFTCDEEDSHTGSKTGRKVVNSASCMDCLKTVVLDAQPVETLEMQGVVVWDPEL
jgi:hypothetical protein